MARMPRPLYMIAFGGYNDFDSLLISGDAAAMRSMIAQSEKWLSDPANLDHPQVPEERERLEQIRAELSQLESAHLEVAVA